MTAADARWLVSSPHTRVQVLRPLPANSTYEAQELSEEHHTATFVAVGVGPVYDDVCALYTSVFVLVIHSEEECLALAMG